MSSSQPGAHARPPSGDRLTSSPAIPDEVDPSSSHRVISTRWTEQVNRWHGTFVALRQDALQHTCIMRIAFFEVAEAWERESLEERLGGLDLYFSPHPLTPDAADATQAEIISVFVHSRVGRETLDHFPHLRFLATRSTGVDHLDLTGCLERGITVSNVPRYGEVTVAEHALGLILCLSRKVEQASVRTRRGDFSLAGLEGIDLEGKTLGVIGAGAIGMRLIRVARCLGMQVLAYDPLPRQEEADALGFRYLPLEELLRSVDVLSLHAPLLPGTHHLLDRERFALLRPGCLLINTARGALVDTEALLWALDHGIVAGAALDVVEGEDLLAREGSAPSDSNERRLEPAGVYELLLHPNVILTPHMAWYSREARLRILQTTVDNILGFLSAAPHNLVVKPARTDVRR